jgi:predicted PhzF superfamily epimerase YddE/YHI9
MRVHELRCFGASAGAGNVALVVEDGPATPAERQAFAAAHARTSVFLRGEAEVEADFFYPHARSPLCLHATLAAAHVLRERGAPAYLTSAMRGQRIDLLHTAGLTFAGVRKQAVAPIGIDPGLPAQLLGEADLVLASASLLASVGSPKLLIEVGDAATLHALRPPLERIVDWGKANGVNGCYVYCKVGEDAYEGRNFNHLDAAQEDLATGVAAGALSAWLGRPLTLYQGAALGNPCKIVTRIDGDTIFVGGATELIVR